MDKQLIERGRDGFEWGAEMEALLRQLLNAIHQDGGHYTAEHGLQKSVHDALSQLVTLRSKQENQR